MKSILCTYLLTIASLSFSQCEIFIQLLDGKENKAIPFAKVKIGENKSYLADEFGRVFVSDYPCGKYPIFIKSVGYHQLADTLEIEKNGSTSFTFELTSKSRLKKVDVFAEDKFDNRSMRTVDHMILTHGKKTHAIDIDKIVANKANNNARELFATVPGLNIWESDGGGLQLGIGARGLSPNRTAHFNTRQNGYDISADALGYPETYYTPPAEAIKNIQIIRGAASLQFGPQFGGMLNFDLIKPSSRRFQYSGTHSYGSFKTYNTFNSVSGTLGKKFSYLGYYKYKSGEGWRENSAFSQQHAYGLLQYRFNDQITAKLELTHMNYLAQQAGGLTDALFEQNPQQSIRDRNWFKVKWLTIAGNFNWEISRNSKVDFKVFKVIASRQALGNLEKISRIDDGGNRDLIDGQFNNIGAEMRFLHHYPIGKTMKATLVSGLRYYQGQTVSKQGEANNLSSPDFYFLNPNNLEGSHYTYPSTNYSAFLENMLRVNSKFWISAGVRVEHINTESEGFYRQISYHPLTEELLSDTTINEQSQSVRTILLGGLGLTYKMSKNLQVYGNVAQNYRGINFSDLRINNPNQLVDQNIKDERGFNADIGLKGSSDNWMFDVNGFFLFYDNKIGVVNSKISETEFVRLRTNIGNAFSSGIEAFAQYQFTQSDSDQVFPSCFVNASYVYARYGNTLESAYAQNHVELVPPFTIKAGFSYQIHRLKLNLLGSYVHQHFSDATNAVFDPNAVVGLIPSYYVMDFGAKYNFREQFSLAAGVNNFTNNKYFTRRASAYPGPGIIPSDGINFYVSLNITLQTSK